MDKNKNQSWNPGRLLDLSGGYWQTCALHAGVKLDLFTILDDGEKNAEAVAGATGNDLRGLSMLLNALTAMGLLQKEDGRYANSSQAARFLSRNSPDYLGYIINHHHHLMDSWAHLDVAVRTGRSLRERSAHREEEWRENFLMGMFNLASMLAPHVVRKIDLSNRSRLLDLGGGPGTYAIHFCLENPQLNATVYDLPSTRPFAEKTIARFVLEDRIRFMDGNFIEKGIEGRYDAAWLSHILHGEDPDGCRKILSKAAGALEPGGMLMVQEFILEDDLAGPLFPTLFSLNMLLGTEGGRSYSEAQIRAMMEEAGVKNPRRVPTDDMPGETGIIVGEVA